MEITKGNWEVKIDAEFTNQYKAGMKTKRHKIMVGDTLIATVWAGDEFRNMETAKQEEANANAILISLAPRLLKALRMMKGVMPFHDGEYTEGESNAMYECEETLKLCEGGV